MSKGRFLILFLILSCLIPFVALSDVVIDPPPGPETVEELVDAIINFIFTLSLAIAPVMVLIGAFYIMTAAGDTTKLTKGRDIITYTVIGLAVLLLAKGLISAIRYALGGSTP